MKRLEKIQEAYKKYLDFWRPIDIANDSFLAARSFDNFCEALLTHPDRIYFDIWGDGFSKRDVLNYLLKR
jgi:hypothetical protein